jgi:hypothetical protein
MVRKILLVTLGGVALLLAFLLGKVVSDSSAKRVEAIFSHAEKVNSVSSFRGYVEISERIGDGRFQQAKCIADLRASLEFESISKCWEDERCNSLLASSLEDVDLKLLHSGTSRFKYYKSGDSCLAE